MCKEHLAIGIVNRIGKSQSNYSKTRGHLTATLVYFIGELYDRTYRLGSVTIKTKCVKLNYLT